ncbi:MAG: hypothetical protein SNG20_07835, partial [Rikenellaceae bacterium]
TNSTYGYSFDTNSASCYFNGTINGNAASYAYCVLPTSIDGVDNAADYIEYAITNNFSNVNSLSGNTLSSVFVEYGYYLVVIPVDEDGKYSKSGALVDIDWSYITANELGTYTAPNTPSTGW